MLDHVELYRLNGDTFHDGKLLSHHLIEGHIGLVKSFAKRSGYSDPELIGWLNLTLVETVRKAQKNLRDNNLTRYIIANLRSGLTKYRERQRTVTIPRNAYRSGKRVVTESLMEHPVAEAAGDLLELKEMMELVCVNELDSAIIRLSLEGHTHKEMCDLLSIPIRSLKYRLALMRNRTKELYSDVDDCIPQEQTYKANTDVSCGKERENGIHDCQQTNVQS